MSTFRRISAWLRSTGRSGREHAAEAAGPVRDRVRRAHRRRGHRHRRVMAVGRPAADAAGGRCRSPSAGPSTCPATATTAYATARAEAAKNGYANGVNGIVVTPVQDSRNRRRLNVTISGRGRAPTSRGVLHGGPRRSTGWR